MDDTDHREYAWIWETTWPWTPQQIRLVSNLPVDITRLVFEKAMEHRPWPLHLLCVSNQVFRWLEPLIYEHISLFTDQDFDRFYLTFQARLQRADAEYSSFLQRHVRTLFLSPDMPCRTEVMDIVQHLPSLRSLACWDGDPTQWGKIAVDVVLDAVQVRQGKDDFPYTRLRRVSFCASLLVERGFTFAHRAFRDLTHMDILVDPKANWESLRFLNNLTHVSLDMVTDMPPLSTKEILSWFSRFTAAFPSSLKVAILAIVQCCNSNFDLWDSEGDFFYPGWPPPEAKFVTPETEFHSTPWLKWRSKYPVDVDLEMLHPIAQLAFGKIDPRAVPGAVACDLPRDQIFRDSIVYFKWPDNSLDWDGTAHGHRDCWTVAEDLIERRKSLSWAELAAQEPL